MSWLSDATGINIGGDAPTFVAPKQNEGDVKFIKDQISQGDKGAQAAYGQDFSQGLMPTAQNVGRQERALGGEQSQAQVDAIMKKGENLFSGNVKKMMMKNQLESYGARMDELSGAARLNRNQLGFLNQIKMEKMREETERIAARNAAIGSIFGAAGAVGGYAAGGGFSGQSKGQKFGGQLSQTLDQETLKGAMDQTRSNMYHGNIG